MPVSSPLAKYCTSDFAASARMQRTKRFTNFAILRSAVSIGLCAGLAEYRRQQFESSLPGTCVCIAHLFSDPLNGLERLIECAISDGSDESRYAIHFQNRLNKTASVVLPPNVR